MVRPIGLMQPTSSRKAPTPQAVASSDPSIGEKDAHERPASSCPCKPDRSVLYLKRNPLVVRRLDDEKTKGTELCRLLRTLRRAGSRRRQRTHHIQPPRCQ